MQTFYERRYAGNDIVTKHIPPVAPKEEEMKNKSGENKHHV